MERNVVNIAEVELPIDEVLRIKKMRIQNGTKNTRINIITGIHGDELEGQYVCYELNRRIQENYDRLDGIVDIYPSMNPLGMDSITRGIPAFDLDMNRIFPGNREGSMIEYLADKIIDDLKGSDMCIDIHASNIYLTEMPQVRINELHRERLVPFAEKLNVDFIWVHGANTVLEGTLAHTLNSVDTPTLVVEMGVGMRITRQYGDQLIEGIFSVMKKLGMWSGDTITPKTPMFSDKGEDVCYLNASRSGIFMHYLNHGARLKAGDHIGDIVNPLEGTVLEKVCAPVDGVLFTIREFPIVDEGSLIGRILKEER